MIKDSTTKYKLDYQPNKDIPLNVLSYIFMIIQRTPLLWTCLLSSDFIHILRYPLAFYLMGLTIDLLTQQSTTEFVPDNVWLYVGLIFLVLFVGEISHLISHYFTFDLLRQARAELRSDLMAYTLDHSILYFQDLFAGSLARKMSEGLEKVRDLNESIRWGIFTPILGMISSGILLFYVSWIYGLCVFIFLIIILFPVFLKLKKIRKKSQIFADARSKVSGQIVDTLTNIVAVKSFANENLELSEHKTISEAEMEASHKLIRVFLSLDNYRRITLVIFGSGMMVACVLGWQHKILTVGEMATIMGITFNFTSLAWALSFGIINTSESLGSLNDTLETLIKPHGIEDKKPAKSLLISEGEITFKNVSFEYEGTPVFKNLHVEIKPKQRIGLMGPSGMGKSTFVNLIERFFDIQEGEIFIDMQNIADVTRHSLRSQIAMIPQDTALFHRSIMDNIRYGRLDSTDEDIMEASKKAHAHEFIKNLPQGYKTLVGERGVKLSGGERQRIAIARAILKDAPILILDEATSALDSESEELIQESLKDLMKDKTVIAIAHRLSTINSLDRLLVMDQGKIVEDGSHAELLKKGGVYSRMWTMQSGGFLA